MAALLGYCKDNGIEVVGFTPPFAPSVYDRMIASGNYSYIDEISPRCKEIFREYGYEYFEYTDASILGVDDEYFIDGFHGSEVTYAYMIKDIIRWADCLCEHVDTERLDELLDNHYNGLLLEGFIHDK